MKDGTLSIIKMTLETDDTLSHEDRLAILAFCKSPKVAPAKSPPTQYLAPKEVSLRLGVSLRTVQRWITTYEMPSTRIGGSRRIPATALEDLSVLPHSDSSTIKQHGRIVTPALHQGHVERMAV